LRIARAEGKKLALRQPPDCTGAGDASNSGSIANVVACFNYLVLVGHSTCPATAGYRAAGGNFLCKAGDAQVVTFDTAQDLNAPGTDSAW
jgi:hypothetical protein